MVYQPMSPSQSDNITPVWRVPTRKLLNKDIAAHGCDAADNQRIGEGPEGVEAEQVIAVQDKPLLFPSIGRFVSDR